jgi:hypothetical protein
LCIRQILATFFDCQISPRRLWESLGFIFAYVLQTQVCIYSKLWILIAVLGTGMAGYLAIEFFEWKKRPERAIAQQ